jgi:hypothetical protein
MPLRPRRCSGALFSFAERPARPRVSRRTGESEGFMGGVDPNDPSSGTAEDGDSGRPAAPIDVSLAKALRYLTQPRATTKENQPTEEWISDSGVSRAPVDPRRAQARAPLPRGTSLYHSTILSRAHAIDVEGFADDLDASVSLWYTDGGDAGPLFEEHLPTLPEGLPAELRGAFVEIRIPDFDAVQQYLAHPEHEASAGQSRRYIIPSAVANAFPRRVVTQGQAQRAPAKKGTRTGS